MRLFRVEMWGQDKTFRVSGGGSPPNASQTFLVEIGPYLQTIDMVEDMGNGLLAFANGPGTLGVRPPRDPKIEALLREQD